MASDCRARRRNFAGGWRLKRLARDCLLTTQSETREYLRRCTSGNQQFGRFSRISADASCKLKNRKWRPTDHEQEISILLDCFRFATDPGTIAYERSNFAVPLGYFGRLRPSCHLRWCFQIP